jgi:hypothetical protein
LHFNNVSLSGHWNALTSALRTGQPQSGAGAAGMYPARYADRAALETFANAMTAGSLAAALALARRFPWQDYTLVDRECSRFGRAPWWSAAPVENY